MDTKKFTIMCSCEPVAVCEMRILAGDGVNGKLKAYTNSAGLTTLSMENGKVSAIITSIFEVLAGVTPAGCVDVSSTGESKPAKDGGTLYSHITLAKGYSVEIESDGCNGETILTVFTGKNNEHAYIYRGEKSWCDMHCERPCAEIVM